MIISYAEKKVAEYLEPGKKYLIRFGHGLGDTIMFVPCLDQLRIEHPECIIDLYVECGQEEIWESAIDKDDPQYDEIFHLDFPMAEGSLLTKPEKCCIEELGCSPVTKTAILPAKASPFVPIHFHGTALPDSVGCPPEVARAIWNEVKDFGKIPIECHFKHIFHNPVNDIYNADTGLLMSQYDFITRDVRDCRANLHNLIGMLQHSWAFIGVASGPLVAALATIPNKVLYLRKHHDIACYTKQAITSVDVFNYQAGTILKWLDQLEMDEPVEYASDSMSSASQNRENTDTIVIQPNDHNTGSKFST